jgi:regulator of protease activity HflC (stomatin/prohibitin superfamily)
MSARVPERHAGIVERTGRYVRTVPPGRVRLLPVLEQLRAVVDLREQAIAVSLDRVPTANAAVVRIAAAVRFTVVDPVAATYEAQDVRHALEQLSATILRDIAGQRPMEDVLTGRASAAAELRRALETEVGRWGIRIDATEVERVDVVRYQDAAAAVTEE